MSQSPVISHEEALKLHRAGDLPAARAAYDELAAENPQDADLLGLMGVLAMQEERIADAEALLRRAVEAGGGARIKLRNLNNLVALFKKTGDVEAIKAVLAGGFPDWPEGAVPDSVERSTVLSLCEAALALDQPAAGWRLLMQAIPNHFGDLHATTLAGLLLHAQKRYEAAIMPLEIAAAAAPRSRDIMLALAHSQKEAGQKSAAAETYRRMYHRWRVFSGKALPTQRASVLVLNPFLSTIENARYGMRGFHFRGNYAAEISGALSAEYRFHSLLVDPPDHDLPERLPEAELLMNNVVNAEAMRVPGCTEAVTDIVARIGLPVINAPADVVLTTRQNNAILLSDVPNLKVPQIRRYRLGRGSPETIAADIAANFEFPVILRRPFAQASTKSLLLEDSEKTAVLLHDAAAVAAHVRRSMWPEFYAIQYVDLRRPDSFFRKIRCIFVGQEVIVAQAAMYSEWMVSGWRNRPEGMAFYRANPDVIDECNRIVLNPERELGAEAVRTLEAIRARIPLDLFGIDFDVDRDGRVVFFEATAAMVFYGHHRTIDQDLMHPEAVIHRIDEAFHKLVARKIAEGPKLLQ
ncbi:MAG TPA: tetratricopeptide repeat protein [Thermohalobaculum sp.]|nr:tetratricopeptide repeat protein [Thermohalobaculum sp.]